MWVLLGLLASSAFFGQRLLGIEEVECASSTLFLQCDKDAKCLSLLQALHKPEVCFDAVTLRKAEEESYVDLYLTTPPCQAFSAAGQGHGAADGRGTLISSSMKYVQHKRPRCVVVENVRGLLQKKHRPIYRGILKTFKKYWAMLYLPVCWTHKTTKLLRCGK